MAEKSFVTAAHHEDVREVSKDPQTEQQCPSKEIFSIVRAHASPTASLAQLSGNVQEEGGHMKNKTSYASRHMCASASVRVDAHASGERVVCVYCRE